MEKLITIKTLQELKELESYLIDKDFVAFDCETTGVDKDSKIIGFSISAEVNVGYYVILSYWDPTLNKLVDLETINGAEHFFSVLSQYKLVAHNGVFDCAMILNNFKVSLINSLHTDTMVLGHLLNENRSNGLKELGSALYGEDARKEQLEMKESVYKNGGVLTKNVYELYKADADLMAKYGAKDAVLTLNLFYTFVPQLFEEGLDKFFYEDETMPLLKGPTYEMNTVGLRIDPQRLQDLKGTLEAECMEAKAFIYSEIYPHVKDKYPGTNKNNTFNISANQQMAWLLFDKLGNTFNTLTEAGNELCQALSIKRPYAPGDKKAFIKTCIENKDRIYAKAEFNYKTKKMGRPKKVNNYWVYLSCGKETLTKLADKYKFVAKYLEYAKNLKILNTYVNGIQNRAKYNIINPNFLQHGTTSGRYSCKNPNFQNLPRDDKRVKSCVVARPGKVFVGADYSQLEPRVFASVSQDPTLIDCFKNGEDFYSVVGKGMFDKPTYSAYKKDKNSFAEAFPELRNAAKAFALATPYGTSAFQQSMKLGKPKEECQQIIDKYFEAYPRVELMMLEAHEEAKANGVVYNLYGRPRRIPDAKDIKPVYGNTPHGELPYAARNLLNLSMNFRVQSSGASIMNRAAIAMYNKIKASGLFGCHIVLQVHDQLVVECNESDANQVVEMLKVSMEKTTVLPSVDLIAEPTISNDLAGQK